MICVDEIVEGGYKGYVSYIPNKDGMIALRGLKGYKKMGWCRTWIYYEEYS